MTEEDRNWTIGIAIADPADGPLALFATAELASASDPACPARIVSGTDVTYRAVDCTSVQGRHYDGSLRGHNVPGSSGDPEIVATRPLSLEMRGWFDDANGDVVDGTLERTAAVPGNGALYTVTSTFTRDLGGEVVVALDRTADCTRRADGDDCAIEGFVELPVGSYEYEGDYATSGATHLGRVTLRGTSTLVVDFDAAPEGCAPVTIDERDAGAYCN